MADQNRQQIAYQNRLDQLREYVAETGNARVPYRYRVDGLGEWVSHQRKAHRAGTLSDARVAALEAFPGWTWDGLVPEGAEAGLAERIVAARADAWTSPRSKAALDSFYEREGHAKIPVNHIEGDYRLGRWVLVQRDEYRRKKMSADRIRHLEAYEGWVWSENNVGVRRKALKSYYRREHDYQVPPKHVEKGFALGAWVRARRKQYAQGVLSQHMISELEALPDWSWEQTPAKDQPTR